jgi:hypothetical protein
VAVLLLALEPGQPVLVTRTQNWCVPFLVYAPMVMVDAVWPASGVDVLPLAPWYHWYCSVAVPVAATESTRVTLRGMVWVNGCVVMTVGGFAVTLTAALVREQPFALVTVTLYDPAALTTMDCVVAPVDQRYEALAGAVSVTLAPGQRAVEPLGVMTGTAGSGLTVTAVAALVALQPLALPTVTLYEPDALTAMDCVVAPVDHRYDALAGAVSVTEPPAQNVVGPLGVMAGVAGLALTVTPVDALVVEQPFAFVTVTL